jgi:hypothetical protein
MKLSTLLEYQRQFNLLRNADMKGTPLTGPEYVDALKASSVFDYELKAFIDPQKVEVTA